MSDSALDKPLFKTKVGGVLKDKMKIMVMLSILLSK